MSSAVSSEVWRRGLYAPPVQGPSATFTGPHQHQAPDGEAVTERREGKGGEADPDRAATRRHDRTGPEGGCETVHPGELRAATRSDTSARRGLLAFCKHERVDP
jgi:hypothetical protein